MKYALIALSLVCVLIDAPAHAYVFATNSSGTPLRWGSPVKPSFYANWNNNDLLSYSSIFTMLTNSLQRWKNAGSAAVDFQYYQGGTNPTSWGLDGRNAIFFQSQAPTSQRLGSSTLGVTYVFSSSGTIVEADVEFNDEYFNFTSNVTDSSQFGGGSQVFLENVATHEFGHAYGMGHSAVLHSSMVYLEDRGQSKPSCDDIMGLGAAYPASGFTTGRGQISGTVVNGAAAVFGAHVLAVSKARGAVVEGAMTDSTGAYTLENLEPGDYFLLVEPFQATSPISALCGGVAANCSYGTVNSQSVCTAGTAPFKRQFVEASSGVPLTVTVTNGGTAAGGAAQVNGCTAMTDPWTGTNETTVLADANELLNAPAADTAIARWGIIATSGSSNYYKLASTTGSVNVKVLSYGLYSGFDPQISILQSDGTTALATATTTSNVFSNTSNFVNYDASASFTAAGTDYYIKITNSGSLNSRLYPAGLVSGQVDAVNYYLMIVTVDDASTLLPSTASPLLTNNARCEASDSFSAYPDLGPGATNTTSAGGGGGGSSGGSGGGCGVIQRADGGSDNDHGALGAGALFSAWGILAMLCLARIAQRFVQNLR